MRDYFNNHDLTIDDMSRGALNAVYRITSRQDGNLSLVLKQALPYVRSAGEMLPLARERMHYEIRAFQEYSANTPSLIPKIYHENEEMSVIVLEDLKTHNLLKDGLIRSVVYPKLSDHISSFLSANLFKTSSLSLQSPQKRILVDRFNKNSELCEWTERVIFPVDSHRMNRRSRQEIGEELYRESCFNAASVQRRLLILKYKFMTQNDALLHGDLCGGAIMVNSSETFIIDPEFAFVGPFGYDLGSIISTLIFFYVAHKIYDRNSCYAEWILETLENLYLLFEKKFMQLWLEQQESSLGSARMMDGNSFNMFRQYFMENMLQDSVGFIGVRIFSRQNVHIPAVVQKDVSVQEYRDNDRIFQKAMDELVPIFLNPASSIKSIQDVLKIMGAVISISAGRTNRGFSFPST